MALSPSITRLVAALCLVAVLYLLRSHGHAYRIPQFDITYGAPLLRAAIVYFVVALL